MSNPERRLRTPTPPSLRLFRSRCLSGGYDHSLTECLRTVSPHPASPFWSVDCSSVYWRPFNPRIKASSQHANVISQFRSIREVGGGREYGIRSRPTATLWPSYWISVSVISCVRTLILVIGISLNSRIGVTLVRSLALHSGVNLMMTQPSCQKTAWLTVQVLQY